MGWYEAIKDAVEIAQKAGEIDLMRQLVDVQAEMLGLQEENGRLRNEVDRLDDALRVTGELVLEGRHYARRVDGQLEGRYCTVCWDADRRLIRLHGPRCGYCDTERGRGPRR